MLEASQPWSLFGYDVRGAWHFFRSGWQDFLWSDTSPVADAVDEIVAARDDTGGVRYFRAGRPVAPPVSADSVLAQAVLLPDHLVLCKSLLIPAAAERDLEAVLGLEITSSSPFPKSDTCFGWSITERGSQAITVQLVISSKSAVMSYVAAQTGSHAIDACEVWAHASGKTVLLTGFGEGPRLQRNRRRLARMAAMLVYCVLAVVVLVALSAGAKYLELRQVRAIEAQVEESAGDAVTLRTQLGSAKARIKEINELLGAYPSPHRELKRLSALLDDQTWISMIDIQGAAIKIEGQSTDASAVMQKLLHQSAYASVEAPVAIRKVGTGSEQFVLKLTLAPQAGNQ